jgi:MoaA/NifB/PqqE/SkfB family radical SAM enzyme
MRQQSDTLNNVQNRLTRRARHAWNIMVHGAADDGRDVLYPCARRQLATQPSYTTSCAITPDAAFFELEITLDLPVSEARRYEHSKLYYTTRSRYRFSEEHVVTFRIERLRTPQRIRIVLPDEAKTAKVVRVRIDPAPLAESGEYALTAFQIAPDDDSATARTARLEAHKEWVRRQIEASEASSQLTLDHYPSSLILELTPRCNLTCVHCSSHGHPEWHRTHNRMPEMSPVILNRLADEVFPSLTSICLVGRGEPTLASDRLWRTFTAAVIKHRVLLVIITNGCFIPHRITPELLPFIDNITFSIDGLAGETFAANRIGASFDKVWEAVEWFHDQRQRCDLARRPRLNFSWTLKRNNIAEFPEFVRRIASVEADALYTRHLLMYYEKDREQSLIDNPALANPYLREAYELLARYKIGGNSMPLSAETVENASRHDTIGVNARLSTGSSPQRDGCVFIRRTGTVLADGAVLSCGAPYVKTVGVVNQTSNFMSVWNGAAMKEVRTMFDTPAEWAQCQHCWFREGAYQQQRRTIAAGRRPDMTTPEAFTEESWDFCSNNKAPGTIADQDLPIVSI